MHNNSNKERVKMNETDLNNLTIRHVQKYQPWTVPYSYNFIESSEKLTYLMGTHCALHAMKTTGKIAAVFEALDHGFGKNNTGEISPEQLILIANMSADLVTVALRFANLFNFDLASKLEERVKETNGITWPSISKLNSNYSSSGGCDEVLENAFKESHGL